jgi:hypothetical protein
MEPRVAEDVLWGVKAIAKEVGQPERQVYYKLERGLLPAGKSGDTWVASRQALRAHFKELTAARQTRRTKRTAGSRAG